MTFKGQCCGLFNINDVFFSQAAGENRSVLFEVNYGD